MNGQTDQYDSIYLISLLITVGYFSGYRFSFVCHIGIISAKWLIKRYNSVVREVLSPK